MTDLNTTAREMARHAVITLARASGAAIGPRTLPGARPGTDFDLFDEPEPLAAMSATRHLTRAARQLEAQYVKWARQDGHSWARIGEALGYTDDPDAGIRAAPAAFEHVAPARSGYDDTFGWTCMSCRKVIIDHGPEAGHPADAERGHADGCERFAEAVAAYDAQWEDE